MARRTQTYAIRLAVEGGGQVKAELVSVGQSGEQSLKRIESAGLRGAEGPGPPGELLRTGIRTLGGALIGAATVGGLGADRSPISAANSQNHGQDRRRVEALQELRHRLVDIAGTLGNGSWGYIVGTYDKDAGPNKQHLYPNGSRVAQMSDTLPIDLNSAALGIGRHISGIADPFNGHIDDLRISHVQHSDGWIATTWSNMSDPGAFAAAGAEGFPQNMMLRYLAEPLEMLAKYHELDGNLYVLI